MPFLLQLKAPDGSVLAEFIRNEPAPQLPAREGTGFSTTEITSEAAEALQVLALHRSRTCVSAEKRARLGRILRQVEPLAL